MFVYVITNLVNGKQYVGQTTLPEVEQRWKQHLARANCRPNKKDGLLYRAIRKYGKKNFVLNFIELPEVSQSILDSVERKMIQHCNSLKPNGYNLREGGNGGPIFQETRDKISQSLKGRPMTAAHAVTDGVPLSDEHKAHVSTSLKGRIFAHSPRSKETRDKISQTQLGVPKLNARKPHGPLKQPRQLPASFSLSHRLALSIATTENWKKRKMEVV